MNLGFNLQEKFLSERPWMESQTLSWDICLCWFVVCRYLEGLRAFKESPHGLDPQSPSCLDHDKCRGKSNVLFKRLE